MSGLALTDEQYAALRALLARAAGLVFDEQRRDSVAFGVAERLRATGVGTVADYLPLLDGREERQRLLDEVTIQETHFFRNPPQVRALRTHVLPELLRAAQARGERRLRVWSAGCSTGEEPYTVAMLLHGLLPERRGWDLQVLGTDVSERALALARDARYGPRAVQLAGRDDLARFFAREPDGGHRVRPEVRGLVELRHHNLVTSPPPFGPGEVDLVLCRNVTIYFGRDTTRTLMSRFHTTLRDGGYLVLGHSETLWQVSEQYRLVPLGTGDSAAFVYRRLDPDEHGAAERRAVLPDRRAAREPVDTDRRSAARRTRATAPTAEALDLLTAARTAIAEGRYADAARLAGAAAQATPMLADAHYLRGLALVDLGDDASALVELRKAVYLAPQDGFAHFLLAGVLSRLDQAQAGRREYGAAAQTLAATPPGRGTAELGGRSVAELAALCLRLSQDPA